MLAKTHAAIGLLTATLLFPFMNISWFILFPFIILGSVIPDIDHKGSTINNFFPITKVFSFLFVHRGFFHSIFPVFLFLIAEIIFKLKGIGLCIAIGYSSHLFCDALTPLGIKFFHPLTDFHVKGFVPTGGFVESIIFISVSLLAFSKIFGFIF